MRETLDSLFPRYTCCDPAVPVWCCTPAEGRVTHRFFDTSPISPSGRYLGLTRLPHEDRLPAPGDRCEILLVDLEAGSERVVATSRGWDTQLGAGVQWGRDDTELYYNDMGEDWRPHGVKMDPLTGASMRLDGTVYMVSPDGATVASPDLSKMPLTQAGYGVVAPPEQVIPNRGAPDDDGIFVTHTATGRRELLVSLREIVEQARPALDPQEYAGGDFYGFHVRYTLDGRHLMLVLRWKPQGEGKMKHNAVTMRSDGTDIHVSVPEAEWGKGGHHPNWSPDGEWVTINLRTDGETLRLARAPRDGGAVEVMTDRVLGSGHPSLHPDSIHVLTDAYFYEPMADREGRVPLRWIDLQDGTDTTLLRIDATPSFWGPKRELRIDPHPAWDRTWRWVVFNGAESGTRRVYLADLSGL